MSSRIFAATYLEMAFGGILVSKDNGLGSRGSDVEGRIQQDTPPHSGYFLHGQIAAGEKGMEA